MPILSNPRHERFAQELAHELVMGGVCLAAVIPLREGESPFRNLGVFRLAFRSIKDEARRRGLTTSIWRVVWNNEFRAASIEAVCK